MNEPGTIFSIAIAAFILVTLIALVVRLKMDRRDTAIVVAGNQYSRKFHVVAEEKVSARATSCDFTPIKQYLTQRGFRVSTADGVLAANSRLLSMWPLFVCVTRENECTIRVYDRFLQPIMIPFVARRYQQRVTELAEKLRKAVEQGSGADS